jgi:hypothetical protein
MLAQRTSQKDSDIPLDFVEFLSGRLGTGQESALSALGSFLVTFKPSVRREAQVANATSPSR